MKVRQDKIAQFVSKHGCTEEQQFKALVEETGELSEALNRESSAEEIEEELADIIFVARSIGEIHDLDLTSAVNAVSDENLQKDSESDGSKVTKSQEGDFGSRTDSEGDREVTKSPNGESGSLLTGGD